MGGTDTITVNNVSGTTSSRSTSTWPAPSAGRSATGRADVVIVNGTIDVFGAGTSVSVVGLSAQVNITNSEGANDSLVINALGGNDVAFMGAGDDVFQGNPGDGNDTIEGQDGVDTMLFFGANVAENTDIVANGGRVLFVRNVANVTMDLDEVESIDFRALGGADDIEVGDLSGTDVTQIALDLRGPNGGGDGAADTGKGFADFHIQRRAEVAITDDVKGGIARRKPRVALYVGGMRHHDKNFYKDMVVRRGFGDAAQRIQKLFLAKRKDEATAAVPDELCDEMSLGSVRRA